MLEGMRRKDAQEVCKWLEADLAEGKAAVEKVLKQMRADASQRQNPGPDEDRDEEPLERPFSFIISLLRCSVLLSRSPLNSCSSISI